jgi:AraC-like DNA-binding protein
MYVVDDFLSTAEDSRLAVVAVAVVLGWPSARGLTLGNIADQLGCSPSTLTRCIARFKTLAGLGVSAGGISGDRNGIRIDPFEWRQAGGYCTVKSTPLKS